MISTAKLVQLAAAAFCLTLAGAASATPGPMVCTAKTTFGGTLTVTVRAEAGTADVVVTGDAGAIELSQQITGLASVWDGHETGLITGPGLAVRYANDYGCYRRIAITTNVRGGGIGYIETLDVAGCLGGTTPDDVCYPHGL